LRIVTPTTPRYPFLQTPSDPVIVGLTQFHPYATFIFGYLDIRRPFRLKGGTTLDFDEISMKPFPKSGPNISNKFALGLINAFEKVLGKQGLDTLLNQAQLQNLIGNYPPDDLKKRVNFTDVSALNQALEELYGPRGGRGLAIRVGRSTYSETLRKIGALGGTADEEFKMLPVQAKIELGLLALARVFSLVSDQHPIVEESEHEYIFRIHDCPFCWERQGSDSPSCFTPLGILQESMNWFSGGGEFRVSETKCSALGDNVCEFSIQKTPVG